MKLEDTKPTEKRPLTITFTVEEQDVLFAVLNKIAGDTEYTGRKHTDALVGILEDEGHTVGNNKYYDRNQCPIGIEGSIYFKETSK